VRFQAAGNVMHALHQVRMVHQRAGP
jgi:hypothetical protein